MPEKSFKVADNLYLVNQTIDGQTQAPAKPVDTPTNHVLVIDVSGSMSYELPQIRTQLKKKLPKMLRESDTISIIWFSGTGQHGVLLEAEPVATLTDLKTVEAAIDRWLKPVGLTAFEGPLTEASKVVERIQKARPGSAFSLIFLSDGADNCSRNRTDIFKAVDTAAKGVSSVTFVEYGFYADRQLLTAMAERAGGQLIFAENFDKFEPTVGALLQKKVVGTGKRIEVGVKGDAIGGFVWTQADGDLVTYGIADSKSNVPEHTKEIWYLSPTAVGNSTPLQDTMASATSSSGPHPAYGAGYAAISLFSVRCKPDIVLPFLKATGDVAFIERFGSLYGKQKYSEFMDMAKSACFDASKRQTKGCNPKLIPAEDAFTVLDMLRMLAEDDANKVLADHPLFDYNRISRGRVDANSVLTDDEQAEVASLTAEMAKTKQIAKIKELGDKIDSISNKPAPLKFVRNPSDEGYSVSNLVYNEEHPNVSILIRREGTVDVGKHAPAEILAKIPAVFPTSTFRNYAIIKDGIVNVKTLPVRLSAKTLMTLMAEASAGRMAADVITADGDVTLLNLSVLPVINRKMVKAVSATTLFKNEWALTKVQAAQKVYNTVAKELVGTRKSASFEEKYGPEAALWLKDSGFTDQGFSPKQVQADSIDFYMAKELAIKIKSFSSIPSLNEFKKQAAKGKFTPSASLMSDAHKAVEAYQATDDGKDVAKAGIWLKAEAKKLDAQRRTMISDKAQAIFCIVVGQIWPTEFQTLDENSMSLTLDGQKLDFTLEAREVEVKV